MHCFALTSDRLLKKSYPSKKNLKNSVLFSDADIALFYILNSEFITHKLLNTLNNLLMLINY
jgi:hypothetical protein